MAVVEHTSKKPCGCRWLAGLRRLDLAIPMHVFPPAGEQEGGQLARTGLVFSWRPQTVPSQGFALSGSHAVNDEVARPTGLARRPAGNSYVDLCSKLVLPL
jgi:hypothetical protein